MEGGSLLRFIQQWRMDNLLESMGWGISMEGWRVWMGNWVLLGGRGRVSSICINLPLLLSSISSIPPLNYIIYKENKGIGYNKQWIIEWILTLLKSKGLVLW
jgi:hypothetical protein